jgi:hypothetical protein
MSAGRQTYTSLLNDFFDNSGNPGSTNTTLIAFFDRHLGARYQDLLAEFSNYKTEAPPQTAATVLNQQFYHNPPGIVDIESVNVDIGDQNIPLQVVNSQFIWDNLNYITISNYPTHIFPRRDDFGLWPIPDAVYTINFASHYRDRGLTTADITTGTVTATNNDATITHSGTSFTALMVGRWFKVDQDGYWYRIASFTDTANLELESVYEGSSGSSLTYVIGQSPELPEEIHILLSYGVAADYFRGPRKDKTTADDWEAMYLVGLEKAKKRYVSRSNSRLIKRNMIKKADENVSFLWSKTIT